MINDEAECATILTLIFKNKKLSDSFAQTIGTKTITNSGWHVYNNMEQILEKKTVTKFKCPYVCSAYEREREYKKNMLPHTDDILERAVNISIGVVDKGIGAGYGINIKSTKEDIIKIVSEIKDYVKKIQ